MSASNYLILQKNKRTKEYEICEAYLGDDVKPVILSYETLENAVLGAKSQMKKEQYEYGLIIGDIT